MDELIDEELEGVVLVNVFPSAMHTVPFLEKRTLRPTGAWRKDGRPSGRARDKNMVCF